VTTTLAYLLGGLTERLGGATAGIATLGGLMFIAGGLIAATCKGCGLQTLQNS
jgi:hypothetical protein